jgi:hypothetical protein
MAIKKRTVTLSDAEWEALRLEARSQGVSRHQMFRKLGQDALRMHPEAGALKTPGEVYGG